jgi:hypothetical protein
MDDHRISHGICPDCLQDMQNEISAIRHQAIRSNAWWHIERLSAEVMTMKNNLNFNLA